LLKTFVEDILTLILGEFAVNPWRLPPGALSVMIRLSVITLMWALVAACATAPRHPDVGFDFPDIGARVISLDGSWDFRLDTEGEGLAQGWATADTIGWDAIEVPGYWERQGWFGWPGDLAITDPFEFNGQAWYRLDVAIPAGWAGYDLLWDLGRVDDGAFALWNGEVVGETHALHESNRNTVPADLVRAGEVNALAVRVTDGGGPGGFDGGPVTIRPLTPWMDMGLDLMSMPGDYLSPAGEHVDFNIRVENPLPEGFFADVGVVVTPFGREPIHDVVHGPIWVNAEPDYDYTNMGGILLGELPPGHYRVDVTLLCDGTVVAERERAFAVTQPVEHMDPAASPFGLCGGALFHLDRSDHSEEGEVRLRQLEATGVVWGRNDLWWGQIEPEPDVWDWRKCDSVVDRFVEHGIELLAILSYGSAWDDGDAPADERMLDEWLDYVRHIVARYGDRVSHWEVWNEPNLAEFWHPQPDLDAYIAMLRETHTAIKEVRPEAQVIGVCTSGVPLDFIRPILDAGGAQWMDALSVHPYQVQPPTEWSERIPHGQLRMLREELDARGHTDLPIWITEEGWPTVGRLDYRTQAEHLVKFFVQMLASDLVERVYWFNLTDWGEPGDSAGGHFGLVEIDHTPKPSFAAFNNLIARLHDFDAVEDESIEDLGWHRCVFRRPEGHDHGAERIIVTWSEHGPMSLEIPTGAVVIDLVGSPIEERMAGVGVHPRREPLGATPIFIVEEIEP
jgi:polysaccharide biosynthesis protein PslG